MSLFVIGAVQRSRQQAIAYIDPRLDYLFEAILAEHLQLLSPFRKVRVQHSHSSIKSHISLPKENYCGTQSGNTKS